MSKGPFDLRANEASFESARKLTYQLQRGRITFIEYAYNLTLNIIKADDSCIPKHVEGIPASVLVEYGEYLRNFAQAVDYMPCPRPLMVGNVTDEQIMAKKSQLRPKYVRLHQAVTDRIAAQ